MSHAKQRAAVARICIRLQRREGIDDLPAGRGHQNRAEKRIQQILRADRDQVLQEQRADEHARHSARKHEAERAPGHVAAGDLRRHQDQLHGSREHQADANRDRRGHAEKQHQHRHGDGARAHPGQRDKQRDEKSNDVLHSRSAPFALLSRPVAYDCARRCLECECRTPPCGRPSGPSADRWDRVEARYMARSRSRSSLAHKAAAAESRAARRRTTRRASSTRPAAPASAPACRRAA